MNEIETVQLDKTLYAQLMRLPQVKWNENFAKAAYGRATMPNPPSAKEVEAHMNEVANKWGILAQDRVMIGEANPAVPYQKIDRTPPSPKTGINEALKAVRGTQ